MEPSFVSKGDIDKAIGRRDEAAICVGLRMKEAETRSYAAEKLVSMDELSTTCLCENLKFEGRWDASVLEGARKVKDDGRAACAAALLDDPAAPERAALATALLDLKIPTVRARLVTAATSDADPAVAAAAVPVFTGTKDAAEVTLLAEGLGTKPVPWAVAASKVLASQPAAAPALRSVATTHADAGLRAAALDAYRQLKPEDFGQVVCDAMMKDADPGVRQAAVAMVKSTRDDAILGCLRDRAFTEEPDAQVRLTLLQTLAKAGAPKAADILCEVVPFWVRTYVKDTPVQEESVDDVLWYQNDRDFERSYACAESAYKAGGYSCWGRAYVASRFKEFGGKASFPRCPGAPGTPGASGGGGEITFGE